MLNWINAVSGAASNLPSALTKTVLAIGPELEFCACENELTARTAQRQRQKENTAAFIGWLLLGDERIPWGIQRTLYTSESCDAKRPRIRGEGTRLRESSYVLFLRFLRPGLATRGVK